MDPFLTTIALTIASNYIAKGKSNEDLSLMSTILFQVATTLSTIALLNSRIDSSNGNNTTISTPI